MRALTTLVAAVVLAAGIGQDARPIQLKLGSVMTYEDVRIDQQGNTSKSDVTYTVTKVEGLDKFFIDANDGNSVAKLVFSYSGEFLCWGTVGEDGTKNNMQLYKVGANKGDSWKPSANAPDEVKMTYEDDEVVTTAAGKFQCRRLVITAGGGIIKVSFWVADKVGLVKASKELFGTVNATIELKKFVEGK